MRNCSNLRALLLFASHCGKLVPEQCWCKNQSQIFSRHMMSLFMIFAELKSVLTHGLNDKNVQKMLSVFPHNLTRKSSMRHYCGAFNLITTRVSIFNSKTTCTPKATNDMSDVSQEDYMSPISLVKQNGLTSRPVIPVLSPFSSLSPLYANIIENSEKTER